MNFLPGDQAATVGFSAADCSLFDTAGEALERRLSSGTIRG
ncbi:hypothetical protein [Rhodobacter sp. 24-YEA-8]|nr:hypothetical protein SAMN05519105_3110 [Rhodobacter sp. 24-YEA-8]